MRCPECGALMHEYEDEQVCPQCGHVELKELDFNDDLPYYDPRGAEDDEC